MNNILKKAFAGSLLIVAASLPGIVSAQTANVALNGLLAGNAGASTFTGFPISSTYNLQLNNTGSNTIAQNVLRVQLILPTQLEFMPTYPGAPAGWVYTRIDNQTAVLENVSDPVESPFDPGGGAVVIFNVPIKTIAATTGAVTFGWGVLASLAGQFAGWVVPTAQGNQGSGFITVLNATPLNIQFKEFTAKADASCAVNLTWKTVAEKNTEKFQIERSNDGSSYNVIGEVKSATTLQEVNEYSFVDRTPANNQNLYRIRQIVTGGKPTVSSVENVKMQCQGDAISVYPNPTEGIVYVKGLTDKGTVKIFNAVGQLVLEKEVQNSVEGVNMNGLANGFYQIHVMKGEESVFSTKLIKK